MTLLRLFIAIELGEELKKELRALEQDLEAELRRRSLDNAVRWVAPQNIHLTLKFLGNAEQSRVPALTRALEQAARDVPRLELRARKLDCFPNTRRPNNIWLGLEGDTERAALLAERIEDNCAGLGLEREPHGFTPHLTLARIRREAPNHARAAVGEVVRNFPPGEYGVVFADSVALIASDLRPAGPVYKTLARVQLV